MHTSKSQRELTFGFPMRIVERLRTKYLHHTVLHPFQVFQAYRSLPEFSALCVYAGEIGAAENVALFGYV